MIENAGMNDTNTFPEESDRANRTSTVVKAAGFWAGFTLLLVGLQHVHMPGFGSAAAPIAAGIILLVMLPVIAWLLRTEGGTWADIGIRFEPRAPAQFAVGLVLGLLMVAVMIGIVLVLTPLEIRSATYSSVLSAIVPPLLIIFVLALMEETVFRSYPLFRLRQALGIRPAVYLSSVVFAFYHGLAFENLLGPGVWGIFFAWMAFSTNSIALPVGFHLGLNWMQSLLGMKPKYGGSLWELSMGPGQGFMQTETVGLILQLLLLVVGVVMVERLIANHRNGSNVADGRYPPS